ncbi:unnamed protein product [Tuber aestivum]|uniref:Uncharacterized protein n=1 Tax=Tuber aestivum TaxID=59557 RepID=A0A292Q0Z1_9PEZI|nr:unnamed protein product [Tuber aestivum]
MHHERKPSLSSTSAYITKGLLSHTTSVSTPDENAATTTSSLGGYFSLSRSTSTSIRKRRPSEAEAASSQSRYGPPRPIQHQNPGGIASSTAKGMFGRSGSSRAPEFVTTGSGGLGGGMAIGAVGGGVGSGPQSPNALYETVHEVATKRIATLDYLRRAHEGRVYWFNTVLFTKADLQRMVYHDGKKLARRANNYFILGNSLPSILDLGTSSPLDYLKAFNHLLQEYEAHIALPPSRQPTARSHSSSISSSHHSHHTTSTFPSVRLPKLFSRSSTKPRRGSSAATSIPTMSTITPPSTSNSDAAAERSRSASGSSTALPAAPAVPSVPSMPSLPNSGSNLSNMSLGAMPASGSSNNLSTTPSASMELDTLSPLMPSTTNTPPPPPPPPPLMPPPIPSLAPESEYLYLSTPPLPFEPDYYETFATLCDVLIDAYSRVLSLVSTPAACAHGVGEAFLKADGKVRRVVVTGVTQEFEDACRKAVKQEIRVLGKEILSGIM